MNCQKCEYTKKIAIYVACGGIKSPTFIGYKKYCTHPEQKCINPIINRGHVNGFFCPTELKNSMFYCSSCPYGDVNNEMPHM